MNSPDRNRITSTARATVILTLLIFGPLQDDVGKALDAYAKARGITLILDASQVEGILFALETIDITRAFIAEYNSKNPATAASATPK